MVARNLARPFLGLAAMVALAVAGLQFSPALLDAAGPRAGAIDDKRAINAANEPDEWLVNGGTLNGEHYSKLAQINLDTIKDLKPAWYADYDTYRGQQAEPIVVDGVMYVSTAWSKVYAFDAATGKQLWFYDPKVPGDTGVKTCCDTVNRGVAVYKGRVFIGALDGRLIALDAATGREIWSTQTVDPKSQLTITGAPRVIRDKVIIGNAGADFGVRGYVSAYDTASGKMVWRFYTAPGDPAKGPDHAASDSIMEKMVRPTWSGDYAKYGGGATAWHAIMYDQQLNRIYIGTGNGSPWNPKYRTAGKGDNFFLCSVIALDPDTGKYIWHYQENPQEAWDYNSVQPMILADLTIDGVKRHVLMHAPKNGFFYVIDRVTGKVISAKPTVPVTWATSIDLKTGRPNEIPNARYTNGPVKIAPTTTGSHNWHAMAFNPNTGLVYLSVQENAATFRDVDGWKPIHRGPFNTGNTTAGGFVIGATSLLAWDPVAQKEAWRVPIVTRSGVLATAGGLVFHGDGLVTGKFSAFRADNGQKVWSFDTPNGIQAGAITYMIKGEQYVAINTGNGAGGLTPDVDSRERQNGRMIVFKLNGKATLPPPPPVAPPANPASDPFTAEQVAHGQTNYGIYCARCHGINAATANVIPDLRRSAVLTDKETWQSIVHDGALADNGMVAWGPHLSRDQVEEVRAYVSAMATKLKEAGGKDRNAVSAQQ